MGSSFRRIVKRREHPTLNKRQVKLGVEIFNKIPETQDDYALFTEIFEFIDDSGCSVDEYIEQNKAEELRADIARREIQRLVSARSE